MFDLVHLSQCSGLFHYVALNTFPWCQNKKERLISFNHLLYLGCDKKMHDCSEGMDFVFISD